MPTSTAVLSMIAELLNYRLPEIDIMLAKPRAKAILLIPLVIKYA